MTVCKPNPVFRPWRRRIRRTVFALLAVIATGTAFLWPVDRALEAVALLRALAEVPARSGSIPAGVSRLVVQYDVNGRVHVGDLYTGPAAGSAGGPARRSGLVLVPRLTPHGKDDSHIVAAAGLLAAHGFTVLVPDLRGIRRLRIQPRHARDVADTARHLASRMGARKVGVLAVSYAVGPAVLAALEPGARAKIGYVAGIGGYFDLRSVITFFTTGRYRLDATSPWQRLEPNRIGRWIFARGNASAGLALRDQALLARIAERRVENPAAPVADLVKSLGDEGRRVLALLVNLDPARVPALIAALPKVQRQALDDLSLSARNLRPISAHLLLLHGKGDAIIPWTESRKLATALPSGKVTLYLPGNLDHVEIGPGSAGDMLDLWRAVRDLLAMRDRYAVPAPRQ